MILRKLVYLLLWLLVMIMPWEEIGLLGGVTTISRVIGYAALIVAGLAVLATPQLRPPPMAFIFYSLFAGWSVLSIAWSILPDMTMGRNITNLMLFGLAWMIWEFAPTLAQQQGLCFAFLLGCCGPLISLFLGLKGADFSEGERLSAASTNENAMALSVMMSIAIAVYFAMKRNSRLYSFRLFLWGYVGVAVMGQLYTGSRSGFFSLLAMAAVILVQLRRVNWSAAIAFLACAGMLAYVAPRLLPEQLRERLTETTEAHTLKVRQDIWRAGLEGWVEAPLQGFGFGTYPEVSLRHGSMRLLAHNTWISMLVEEGVIGIFFFTMIWVTVAWRLRFVPQMEKILCSSLLVGYLPATVAGTLDYNKSLWLMFGLVLAMSATPGTSSSPTPMRPPPVMVAVPYRPPRPRNV
jgi:O-antigen ligase